MSMFFIAALIISVLVIVYFYYPMQKVYAPIKTEWKVNKPTSTSDVPIITEIQFIKQGPIVHVQFKMPPKFVTTDNPHLVISGIIPKELRPNGIVEHVGRGHNGGKQVAIWYSLHPNGDILASPISGEYGGFVRTDSAIYATMASYFIGKETPVA